MRSRPLILGIGMIAVGWATGGGAAQILFSIFGETGLQSRPGGYRHDLGLRRHRPGDAAALSRTRSARA